MRPSFTVEWFPLGIPATSRPPLLVVYTRMFEMPVLVVRSDHSLGEAASLIPLHRRARLVTEKLVTFSRPTADAEKIAYPLLISQSKHPSSSEEHKYFAEAAYQVFRVAGSADGVDVELYYEMTKYVPVEAGAIEVTPGGRWAFAEKGVRKIRCGEDGEISGESSSSSTACCAICLEEFGDGEEAVRLPCSHVLHGMCLERWFCRKHQCPLCRREIMWYFAAVSRDG